MNDRKDLEKKLKSSAFFSVLDEQARNEFLRYGTLVPLRDGRTLFYQGDKAEFVYFVVSGEVKRIKVRSDDTSLILNIVPEGGWVGLAEVMANGPYLTDCVVEDRAEVLSFLKNSFTRFMRVPKFKDSIYQTIIRDYYALHSHIEIHTPLRKITDFFKAKVETFKEKDPETGCFVIAMTQDELAELIGFTRETVNKHLKVLESRGIIRIGRAQIMILDLDQLDQFTE